MIAHNIKREGGSFERLGCYILDISDPTDERAYDRLAGYVIDRVGDGERVVAARVSNCADDDIEMAIAEIELVQSQNSRSRSGKSYHLVVSFPEGERPTAEQLRDIEDHLVASIGFSDHQRISAVHDDTDNLHMHIAINKVHPTTLRNVDPHRDYPKLMAACRELELRHDLILDNHDLADDQVRNLGQDAASPRKPERAIKMEAHSGQQSLASWIQMIAKAEVLSVAANAPSWEVLHEVFGRYGLAIRPRGAGLSVGVPGTKAWVKASSIDRSLSMKPLSGRLGDYLGPAKNYASPQQQYGVAQGRGHQNRRLHEAYTTERASKIAARAAALTKVKQAYGDYGAELRDHYRQEKARVRTQPGLAGYVRRQAAEQIENQRRKAQLERDRLREQAMADTKAAHPLPTWQAFLMRRAGGGDEAALSVLRSRKARNGGSRGDIVTAEDRAAAKDVLYQPRMPIVMHNGDVAYRTPDGGYVTDCSGNVRVDSLSEGAAFLALALASDRFPGQSLVIQGSDAFRAAVLEAATAPWLTVTFADPALDRARRGLTLESDERVQSPPPFQYAQQQTAQGKEEDRGIPNGSGHDVQNRGRGHHLGR